MLSRMELSDVVRRVRTGIVQIATATGSDTVQRVGTGFFVSDDGRVVTALHVVRAAVHGDGAGLVIGIAHPLRAGLRGSFTYVPATLVAEDEQADLAVLQPVLNPLLGEVESGVVVDGQPVTLEVTRPALGTHRPHDGVAVGVSGFPATEPVLVTTAGVVASAWAFDPTTVPTDRPAVTAVRGYYLVDVTANPGNSGGPAYLAATGEVIGVCVSFRVAASEAKAGDQPPAFAYNSGLTLVTPIADVRSLLG
jgi:S1-C subfamily serine protease